MHTGDETASEATGAGARTATTPSAPTDSSHTGNGTSAMPQAAAVTRPSEATTQPGTKRARATLTNTPDEEREDEDHPLPNKSTPGSRGRAPQTTSADDSNPVAASDAPPASEDAAVAAAPPNGKGGEGKKTDGAISGVRKSADRGQRRAGRSSNV